MRSLLARLAGFITRRGDDRALDEEIATHLGLLAAEYERRGMPAKDAQRAARRAFGGVQPMKERYLDGRGFRWVDNLVRDVKYASRTIARNPAHATAVVAILAIGIGANAAVFSLLDAAMFRALPVAAPDRLVVVESDTLISYPTFRQLSDSQRALSGVLATTGPQRFALRWQDGTRHNIVGSEVSGGYFATIGATLAAGRPFSRDDERNGAAGVMVIGYDLWQRRFGGRADALGQTAVVNALPVVVIGVAAEGFRGEVTGASSEAWMLITQTRAPADLENRRGSFFRIMGRLREDVDRPEAQAALTSALRQIVAGDRASAAVIAAAGQPVSLRLQPAVD